MTTRATIAVAGAAAVMVSFVAYNRVAGWSAAVAVTCLVALVARRRGGSADGWVYFLYCPRLNVYKIGWSGDRLSPTRRVDQIVSEADVPVQLLCYGPGPMLLEQSLHDRFAAQHVVTDLPAPTEWFRLDDSQAAEVAALLNDRRQ